MTLARLLDRAAKRRPESVAVVDGARRLTYADLWREARALGAGFESLGVARGDRVVIALKNRLEHVLAYWALQLLGGVPTPVNFRMSGGELRYVLEDSGAKVALLEEATAAAMTEAARGWDGRLLCIGDERPAGTVAFGEVAAPSRVATWVDPCETDLSLILYTSGTTGRPKGVPRTHRNHHAGALAHVVQCGYQWGDMIISGGENVHPVEVEDALARHADVADVAVIGEPDARWGERVVAFVVARRAGLTAAELERHCVESTNLARWKRPRRVVFVEKIPKTPSGKILRRLLRDGQYAEVRP